MIVWQFHTSGLQAIMGMGGITIDIICNSKEAKGVIYQAYKISQSIKRRQEAQADAQYKALMRWIQKNR